MCTCSRITRLRRNHTTRWWGSTCWATACRCGDEYSGGAWRVAGEGARAGADRGAVPRRVGARAAAANAGVRGDAEARSVVAAAAENAGRAAGADADAGGGARG